MYVIGNPVYQAGLGGFEWRDETIMQFIKDDSKLKFKGFITKAFLYAVFLIPAIAFLLTNHWLSVVLGIVLVGFIYFAKIAHIHPFAPALYGAGILLSVAIPNHFSPFTHILITLLALIGITFLVSKEVLGMGSILVASTAVFQETWGLAILAVTVIVVLAIGIYSKQNRMRFYMLHNSKKWSALEESPALPLGYQQIGEKVLKTELKLNAGRISARHRGSKAERKTAIALLGLSTGDFVFHDIPLPGADAANIDHLIVSDKGIFVLDTKLYIGQIVEKNGKILKESSKGAQDLTPIIKQMQWARKSIQQYTPNIPVKALVTVQRAEMQSVIESSGEDKEKIDFVPFDQLLYYIKQKPDILDKDAKKQVKTRFQEIFSQRKPVYAKK